MFPFNAGKKKETKKVYIPVDIVLRYSAQGLSEPDIISRLEEQGFPPEHIDKALRVALKEKVVSGAPPTPMEMTETAPEAPTPMPFGTMETPIGPVPLGEVTRRPQQMPMGYPPERIVQRPMGQLMSEQEVEQPEVKRAESQPATEITVEEIIEAIVAENMERF